MMTESKVFWGVFFFLLQNPGVIIGSFPTILGQEGEGFTKVVFMKCFFLFSMLPLWIKSPKNAPLCRQLCFQNKVRACSTLPGSTST